MDCQEIRKLIPLYLDHELGRADHRRVEAHLQSCAHCRVEALGLERSWEMLAELKEIEPDPNYMARFWRTLEAQRPWYEKILRNVQEAFLQRRWVPALAAVAAVLLVSTIATVQYRQKPQAIKVFAELNGVELEMVANIDLAEDYEIIQDIEFFSDLEVIESLAESEMS